VRQGKSTDDGRTDRPLARAARSLRSLALALGAIRATAGAHAVGIGPDTRVTAMTDCWRASLLAVRSGRRRFLAQSVPAQTGTIMEVPSRGRSGPESGRTLR
jgi:hypothetical protein